MNLPIHQKNSAARIIALTIAALAITTGAYKSCTQPTAAREITGRVVSIADGDTLSVLDSAHTNHRIRLAYIDAPEKKQDFGQKSKQSLSEQVYGHDVSVNVVDTDRYGRLLGVVYREKDNVNTEQVRRGMAWVYTKYNKDPSLVEIEAKARKQRMGLWEQPNPTPPWEFRHRDKEEQN